MHYTQSKRRSIIQMVKNVKSMCKIAVTLYHFIRAINIGKLTQDQNMQVDKLYLM